MITALVGNKTGYMHTAFYVMCTLYAVFWIPTLSVFELLVWLVGSNLLIGYLISGFQHRYCSHKSWQPSRFVEALSLLLCSAFVLTPSMGWASTHQVHHRYTDTEDDPHGNAHSVWHNFMVFNGIPKISRIPRWMIRDKLYGMQAKYYWEVAILSGLLFTVAGLGGFWVATIAVAYIFQVTLNLLGHPNKSPVNNPLLAVIYSGELYHKFHHENPGVPRFGLFDAPYQFFIRFLDVRKNR
jgi:fatty-acid desaturase